jgi:hypothetical protein
MLFARGRKMKKLYIIFSILITSWCLTSSTLSAEALLFDEDEEEIDELFGEGDRVSETELLKRLKLAVTELNASKKREQLLSALSVLTRQKEIVVPPREMAKFRNALLETASSDALQPFVPKLLKIDDADLFDVGARAWLNLGIQLSVAAGGASFSELNSLLKNRRDIIDLEWMLPSLGRSGGKKALRVLRPFRQDQSIIPLGNVQNIRRVPCAAVLGCAYAGDREAFDLIMEWYEQDYQNRPRFAWYLQWAKQEGYKITDRSYALLDYCEHRIKQAERLLDFVIGNKIPEFIERANTEMRIGLTDYLIRKLSAAKDKELPLFAGLIRHPSIIVKRQVLETFLNHGSSQQQEEMMHQIRDMRKSRYSLDRFFAVETLWMLYGKQSQQVLIEAIEEEKNQALRLRFRQLRR